MRTENGLFCGMGLGYVAHKVDPGDPHSFCDRTKGKKCQAGLKFSKKIKRGNVYFFFERLLTDTKSCDKVKASEERGYKR